jgi:predicted molibdopterin-dependent oxidoreductase YjgC
MAVEVCPIGREKRSESDGRNVMGKTAEACPKGWEALTQLAAPDRGTTPLVRSGRDAPLEPCDWERALVLFCERFKDIQAKHDPESVAFLSTGKITTEEMAFVGCLFKLGMGFVHCDSNTRQCMATSHAAYKESFGFDAHIRGLRAIGRARLRRGKSVPRSSYHVAA